MLYFYDEKISPCFHDEKNSLVLYFFVMKKVKVTGVSKYYKNIRAMDQYFAWVQSPVVGIISTVSLPLRFWFLVHWLVSDVVMLLNNTIIYANEPNKSYIFIQDGDERLVAR